MYVMKFGGTSVASAERMEQVVELVTRTVRNYTSPAVVLSAMHGVTNLLIEGAQLAVRSQLEQALQCLTKLRHQHLEAIDKLHISASSKYLLQDEIAQCMEDLQTRYKGVSYLGELSKRSLDTISSTGEILSSKIVAQLAKEQGLNCIWLDAREFMITDETFGNARPLWDKLLPLARNKILPHLSAQTTVFTQGFIGTTLSGVPTTLGRGGSDYSASIIGVAINSDEIQIWTDVDGMLSADPRIVPEATLLSEVSFQEASELAYFGAKVLHPLTIKPAVEKNIPVRILNTFNPAVSGTLIKSEAFIPENQVIRAIAAKKQITAVFISSPRMLMTHGFLAEIFCIFDKYKIPVDLISTSEVSIALTIDTQENIANLSRELSELGDLQILENVAIISVVGRQFRQNSGIAGRIFRALQDINILVISGGASDININFVVLSADADKAVKQLHAEFFSSCSIAVS